MSIENEIKALTAAITALTQAVQGQATPPVVFTPAPPAPPAPAPIAPPPQPVVAAQMPPLPTFAPPPAPVAAATTVPFSNPKGLIEYVMTAYKVLGPQKGAEIQGILTGLGYQNINEVKPEHYPAIVENVEALKARG